MTGLAIDVDLGRENVATQNGGGTYLYRLQVLT